MRRAWVLCGLVSSLLVGGLIFGTGSAAAERREARTSDLLTAAEAKATTGYPGALGIYRSGCDPHTDGWSKLATCWRSFDYKYQGADPSYVMLGVASTVQRANDVFEARRTRDERHYGRGFKRLGADKFAVFVATESGEWAVVERRGRAVAAAVCPASYGERSGLKCAKRLTTAQLDKASLLNSPDLDFEGTTTVDGIGEVLCNIEQPERVPVLQQGSFYHGWTKLAQATLSALGLDPGPVDGVFGPQTEAAVRKFQRDRHLIVDGTIGRQTWTALKHAGC